MARIREVEAFMAKREIADAVFACFRNLVADRFKSLFFRMRGMVAGYRWQPPSVLLTMFTGFPARKALVFLMLIRLIRSTVRGSGLMRVVVVVSTIQ